LPAVETASFDMSNGPNDWLFSGLPIQITVESASHVDWFNIASTIVGIVFGALLTFWLSRISENAREMDLQQRMLNGVLSEVASNINTLLVFKRQFLIQFSSEFELLKRHAQKYVPGVPPPPQLVIEFNEHMRPLLNQIAEQDPSLNNIVKKWNKIPFIHVDGSALPFVLDEIPDLLFLVAMGMVRSELLRTSWRCAMSFGGDAKSVEGS